MYSERRIRITYNTVWELTLKAHTSKTTLYLQSELYKQQSVTPWHTATRLAQLPLRSLSSQISWACRSSSCICDRSVRFSARPLYFTQTNTHHGDAHVSELHEHSGTDQQFMSFYCQLALHINIPFCRPMILLMWIWITSPVWLLWTVMAYV